MTPLKDIPKEIFQSQVSLLSYRAFDQVFNQESVDYTLVVVEESDEDVRDAPEEVSRLLRQFKGL